MGGAGQRGGDLLSPVPALLLHVLCLFFFVSFSFAMNDSSVGGFFCSSLSSSLGVLLFSLRFGLTGSRGGKTQLGSVRPFDIGSREGNVITDNKCFDGFFQRVELEVTR